MTIKAIETEYNGYKFRSRLEARWAVFFDNAMIRYEYEPEGFELEGGGYLPDFFLPQFGLYVEIKPFREDIVNHVGDGNEWEAKCSDFCDETGKSILLCYGDPASDLWMMLYAFDSCDSGGGRYDGEAIFKHFNGKVYLVTFDNRPDRTIHVDDDFNTSDRVITMHEFYDMKKREIFDLFCEDEKYEFFDSNAFDILNSAKKAARQARFEHGETPVVQHGGE